MPRKPTPSILADQPDSSADDDVLLSSLEAGSPAPDVPATPAVETVETPAPTQPEVKAPARPRSKKASPEAAAEAPAPEPAVEPVPAVEAVVEPVETEPVEPEVLIEEIPAESGEAGGISVSIKLPEALTTAMENMPAPVSSTLRIAVLASLGLASYAIETSVFVITKLVERGELTQKEGLKLMGEMSKRVKLPIPGLGGKKAEAEMAVEQEAPAESEEPTPDPAPDSAGDALVTAELGVGELSETDDAPAEEEKDESGNGDDHSQIQTNVLALHVFNLGSPITITSPKMKKKK
jgi:polyhydroxyalkanoate synthesis regulator phasin